MTFLAPKPLAACLAVLVGLASQARAQEPVQLVVGVRSEARPFSYRLSGSTVESDATRGPLSRAGYGGYMIRICDAVLAEMLVDTDRSPTLTKDNVVIHDIDEEYHKAEEDHRKAEEAASRQQGGASAADPAAGADPAKNTRSPPPIPSEWRFAYLGKKFDILCDPATITNEHRTVTVSPPLFLSGIGYLKLRDAALPEDPCGTPDKTAGAPANTSADASPVPALIGLVGGTTAATRGLQALVAARELPKFETQLIEYLRANKPCEGSKVLVQAYPDHQEAARQFCRGTAFHYYVGDLDIIRAYASAIAGCRFDNGTVTYTNDRYGIFGQAIGSIPEPAATGRPSEPPPEVRERELLVARFFEILAQKVVFNPSVLDKAYEDTFPDRPQSRKLQLFYWAVRGERMPAPPAPLTSPASPEPAGETTATSPANDPAPAPDPG